MLQGKKILLGITGSISAYKINYLVRHLVKAKAEVKVIATPAALDFISPLTLSTLSKNPVAVEFTNSESGIWNNHVELGEWADVFVVAPASANTLAKMAAGICDNLLLAVYLSAKCPVWFAPAMDLDMYQHPSTKNNIATLLSYGNRLIPPGSGELASGLVGEGRLEEPEEIANQLIDFFKKKNDLAGYKALVTAGPTYEYIDPVRFIGNPSSGKMGIAVADELANRGAEVHLICGPSAVKNKNLKVARINVKSAQEMFEAAVTHADSYDIAVMAAAVSDFTPQKTFTHKVKKQGVNNDDQLNIELKRTQDILKCFGDQKQSHQVLIGFAMETDQELENAQQKLSNKNADLIVLNSLNEAGAGFQHNTNKVTFVGKNKEVVNVSLKDKTELAVDLVDKIIELQGQKNQ